MARPADLVEDHTGDVDTRPMRRFVSVVQDRGVDAALALDEVPPSPKVQLQLVGAPDEPSLKTTVSGA